MTIKNFYSKPVSWVKRGAVAALLAGTAALLGSCGGSGVSSETGVQVGALSLNPPSGSLYANVPFTFTIAGGVKPYTVTTSEQTLIPNQTVSGNTFTVVPNNPGVQDVGQADNEVPSRSIVFTVRDNAGTQITTGTTSFRVLRNFITGYDLSITSLFACGAGAAQGCTGTESAINLRPTFAGVLYRNRPFRFSINYGEFLFVDKNSAPPNQLVNSLTLTTSGSSAPGGTEGGTLTAFLRVSDTARTQYAGFRITDVQSGVFRDVDFLITNPTVTTRATLIPPSIGPLAGVDSSKCGSGGVDVRISGGVAPYTIAVSASSRAIVSVNPPVVVDSNGIFTVGVAAAPAPNSCLNEPNAVTVTDALGQVTTFGVNTVPGTTAAIQPLTVAPNSVCLPDAPGSSVSIAVNGGNALKVLNSSNTLKATVAPATNNGTFSATITTAGIANPPAGEAVQINVSDGAGTLASVFVTRKATCP